MKKLILLICCMLCFNRAYAISTVDELIEHCKKDPYEISLWIAINIHYRSDKDKWNKRDYFQSPSETLSTDNKYNERTGDCEDYAILAYACMKQLGYEPKLFVIQTEKDAHCICIVKYNEAWYYLGEEIFTKTSATSYEEILKIYNTDNETKYDNYYFLTENEVRLD